jgi:hypothetical protein
MIFNALKIIDYVLVISYKFFTSHLTMFKIHVHSKIIIPLFYFVIDVMHISRLLNQHKTLASFYQLLVNLFKYAKLFENCITFYCGQ